MTRTSSVILQTLIIAIFASAMLFFAKAVSRAEVPHSIPLTMMTLDAYEAMPAPQPRQDLDAGIMRLPPLEAIVRPCSGSAEGMTTWRIEDEPKKLEDAIEDNDELDEL